MQEKKLIEFSWQAIFKIIFVVFFIYLVYLLRDILVLFIFAITISILVEPLISFFSQKLKIHRVFGVVFVYLLILLAIAGFFYFIVPPIFGETKEILFSFPSYFEKLYLHPNVEKFKNLFLRNIEDFTISQENLTKVSKQIISLFSGMLGGVLSFFMVIFLAFFLSLEENVIEKWTLNFFPKRYGEYFLGLWKRYQRDVSGWFGLRILTAILIGIVTFIFLYLMDVRYPLTLGVLYGVAEIVPILGPIIGGIIIAFFAFLDSWIKALWTIIFLFLIQQVENFLTPLLSKKFVSFPPILTLLAIIVGGKLFGFLGAILAIPLMGLLFRVVRDYLKGVI